MSENWLHVAVMLPEDEGLALVKHIQDKHGFPAHETDWCENERADFALYDYGPCERPTKSRYAVTPAKYPEGAMLDERDGSVP